MSCVIGYPLLFVFMYGCSNPLCDWYTDQVGHTRARCKLKLVHVLLHCSTHKNTVNCSFFNWPFAVSTSKTWGFQQHLNLVCNGTRQVCRPDDHCTRLIVRNDLASLALIIRTQRVEMQQLNYAVK